MQHDSDSLTTAYDAFQYILPHFNWEQEEVHIVALNSRQVVIGHRLLFRGTVDFCPVHPRDIFRYLILQNASAFLLFHNHPSGSPDPSIADIQFSRKLKRLSKLMEIQFLDHLILTQKNFFSLRDAELL